MQATSDSSQLVQDEILRRIKAQIWAPGELMPTENELADEFGCARATVKHAIRELASAGLLERRRKGGTRVVLTTARKAAVDIPIVRLEVEGKGLRWDQTIIERKVGKPPLSIAEQLGLGPSSRVLRLRTVHFASRKPYAYEVRWVNLAMAPEIEKVDLTGVSANEWLAQNVSLTSGETNWMAANATAAEAKYLETTEGDAIFVCERTTFNGSEIITAVRLAYATGHLITTQI
ncbi:MAG: GntR family transcriptional regulator [Burkholderiaceae bacterium]